MEHPFEFSKVRAWVVEAGNIALSYYQTQLTKRQKDDYSPVTVADEAVEQFIINKIRQTSTAGDVSIIAEESEGHWENKEYIWAIDPIDGTRVFINGVPLWCISVGLLRNGEAYRGVVYLPVTNDIYYTNDDGDSFWNNRPLKGMLQSEWDRDSFIAIPSVANSYFDIKFRRLRALGAVATHHVYVASGVALAALHREASVWDLAGAHAILTAVGGVAVYLDGALVNLAEILAQQKTTFDGPILAGHPAVVEKLLPLIDSYQA